MSLALSDVKRLAILAQLELSDEQASSTLEKLNGIFRQPNPWDRIQTRIYEALKNTFFLYVVSDKTDRDHRPAERQHLGPTLYHLPAAGVK